MEKNNQCSCVAPQWCPDENQMEPGYTCGYCHDEQLRFDKATLLMLEIQVSIGMKTNDHDDLPF